VKVVDGVAVRQLPGRLQTLEEIIALRVDIRRGDMRDLASPLAQSDPFIKAGRTDPDWPAAGIASVHLPKADMMAMPGAVADLLLEGEIFLAAKEEQVADRRVRIGPAEHGRHSDFEITSYPESRGRRPFRGRHRPQEFLTRTDERDVERVAWDASSGVGDARHIYQGRMFSGVVPPKPRCRQVGDPKVDQRQHRQPTANWRPRWGSLNGGHRAIPSPKLIGIESSKDRRLS
jgi:hypothetical protein